MSLFELECFSHWMIVMTAKLLGPSISLAHLTIITRIKLPRLKKVQSIG